MAQVGALRSACGSYFFWRYKKLKIMENGDFVQVEITVRRYEAHQVCADAGTAVVILADTKSKAQAQKVLEQQIDKAKLSDKEKCLNSLAKNLEESNEMISKWSETTRPRLDI